MKRHSWMVGGGGPAGARLRGGGLGPALVGWRLPRDHRARPPCRAALARRRFRRSRGTERSTRLPRRSDGGNGLWSEPRPIPARKSRTRNGQPQSAAARSARPADRVVRRGRASLREAPGGRVVKRLGWRTAVRLPDRARGLRPSRRVGRGADSAAPRWTARLGEARPLRDCAPGGRGTRSRSTSPPERRGLRLGGRVLRSFAVTVGSPASPTPTGRFAITDTFRGRLNPAYGCCALATTATQPSLPSGWLGGSRIAIHGTTGPLGEAALAWLHPGRERRRQRPGRPRRARDPGRHPSVVGVRRPRTIVVRASPGTRARSSVG